MTHRLTPYALLLSVLALPGCDAPDPNRAERAMRAGWLVSTAAEGESVVDLVAESATEEASVEGPVGDVVEAADQRAGVTEVTMASAEAGTTGGPSADEPESEPLRPYRPPMHMDQTGPMIHTQPELPTEFSNARFHRPENVRGLYANAWVSGSSRRMTELLDLARRTEINSLVIDIKDATGFISHRTQVELAHEIGATEEIRIRDLPGLLDRLEAEGIYPIARIVVVKDPILSAARPEWAVQDTAGGIWVDSKEIIWMNLFSEELWRYNISIAREVAEMGFPEIQWDYIRFPDAPQSDMDRAVFAGGEGRPRYEAVRGFLAYAEEELSDLPVRSTADVFGVTTSFRREFGIGQLWETFIDVVDAALPMVYPSHYRDGFLGYDSPNAYPYEVVHAALRDAMSRSSAVDGAGRTRPWLQDFSLGKPIYGAAEVRAQIQAAYDVGIDEWILWNPSSRYTESAIEPVGGFTREPLMRVAGVLAPVSRRRAVMDSVAALPVMVDSVPDTVASDTVQVSPSR